VVLDLISLSPDLGLYLELHGFVVSPGQEKACAAAMGHLIIKDNTEVNTLLQQTGVDTGVKNGLNPFYQVTQCACCWQPVCAAQTSCLLSTYPAASGGRTFNRRHDFLNYSSTL